MIGAWNNVRFYKLQNLDLIPLVSASSSVGSSSSSWRPLWEASWCLLLSTDSATKAFSSLLLLLLLLPVSSPRCTLCSSHPSSLRPWLGVLLPWLPPGSKNENLGELVTNCEIGFPNISHSFRIWDCQRLESKWLISMSVDECCTFFCWKWVKHATIC